LINMLAAARVALWIGAWTTGLAPAALVTTSTGPLPASNIGGSTVWIT
jgi:hypothetical protein